jgi:glycine C-acetyltransferase
VNEEDHLNQTLNTILEEKIDSLKSEGRFRQPHSLESGQGPEVLMDGKRVIMLASNNYLGFAAHPKIMERTIQVIKKYGCSTTSVSHACGITDLHLELMRKIASFTKKEASLLYSSCSTANMGIITALMEEGDIILSDELNHASIIDGCRMSRAETKVYSHCDMKVLEELLQESQKTRLRMIITDGVFSMEGDLAPLPEITRLAGKYGAITVVDESHAVGILGARGSGSVEHFHLEDEVNAETGTFGKALGGGGGYVVGSERLIQLLYNTSRSFVFTNALTPPTVATAIAAIEMLEHGPGYLAKLWENIRFFREGVQKMGFHVLGGESAIVPIMTWETEKTTEMSRGLFEEGIYLHGVGHPVVPKWKARLRAQISAAHEQHHLEKALEALQKVGRRVGLIP